MSFLIRLRNVPSILPPWTAIRVNIGLPKPMPITAMAILRTSTQTLLLLIILATGDGIFHHLHFTAYTDTVLGKREGSSFSKTNLH